MTALLTMFLLSGTASAALKRPLSGTLTGVESPNGVFERATVAVDPSGYLYVANQFTPLVNIYNPAHEYVTSFEAPKSPAELAVDSKGNIYAIELASGYPITVFKPDSYPPVNTTTYAGALLRSGGFSPRALAIDPSDDRLFVTVEAEGGIEEYESAAGGSALLRTLHPYPGLLEFGNEGIAVYGGNHDIYVANSNAESVFVFNADGTEVLHEFQGAAGSFKELLTLEGNSIAIDQSNGNVLVGQIAAVGAGERRIEEFEPDGTFVSKFGESLPLSFPGFVSIGLVVDNSPSGDGKVYLTSGEEESVVYEFGPLTNFFELGVTPEGTGQGKVTSSPAGIDCGATCSAEYAEGEEVTLTATAEPGSKFTGFSGACTGTGTCKVTMSEAKAVTASFDEVLQFPLSVSKAGTGSGTVTSSPAGISCGSKCSAEFEEGKVLTLSATPVSGSTFAGWSGACTGTAACNVTMSEAKAVTATFNAQSNGGGGGGGTTNPPPPATCATNAALCPPSTATAATKAQVKSGKAALQISCPGPGACTGKLTLSAKITTGKGKNKKTKTLTIGSASFSLKGGESTTVSVKLSGPAKSALAKGTLKAKLKGTGIAPATVKLSNTKGK